MSLSVKNLKQGINGWQENWPRDFHNQFYQCTEKCNAEKNPNGDFNDIWWCWFLRHRLYVWRATRTVSYADLDCKMEQQRNSLKVAWKKNIVPNIKKDIAQVEWSQIEEFCNIVKKIKGVDSPVFTSKFCHFLAPQIFPVIDKEAMGKPFRRYQDYYERGREDWNNTPENKQAEMINLLSKKIGKDIYPKYPFKTKIIELCYIGKKQCSVKK